MSMDGLKLIPYVVLVLTISGVIIGAAVIALVQFGETTQICFNASYSYNTSLNQCVNATPVDSPQGVNDLNFSDQYYGIDQAKVGQLVVAEQMPTIAIIAVMVIIISLIAGVFVYMNYFK